MKGQKNVATPAEYLAQLEEPRKGEITALDALIRKTAPKLKPYVQMGILAYGPFLYKYPSGREGDWFHIGVASNAQYISLYVTGDCTGSPPERYKEALPKAKIGKGCVRFKRLSDLNQTILRKLIKEVASYC
jgi:hypothetical protein